MKYLLNSWLFLVLCGAVYGPKHCKDNIQEVMVHFAPNPSLQESVNVPSRLLSKWPEPDQPASRDLTFYILSALKVPSSYGVSGMYNGSLKVVPVLYVPFNIAKQTFNQVDWGLFSHYDTNDIILKISTVGPGRVFLDFTINSQAFNFCMHTIDWHTIEKLLQVLSQEQYDIFIKPTIFVFQHFVAYQVTGSQHYRLCLFKYFTTVFQLGVNTLNSIKPDVDTIDLEECVIKRGKVFVCFVIPQDIHMIVIAQIEVPAGHNLATVGYDVYKKIACVLLNANISNWTELVEHHFLSPTYYPIHAAHNPYSFSKSQNYFINDLASKDYILFTRFDMQNPGSAYVCSNNFSMDNLGKIYIDPEGNGENIFIFEPQNSQDFGKMFRRFPMIRKYNSILDAVNQIKSLDLTDKCIVRLNIYHIERILGKIFQHEFKCKNDSI